MKQENGKLRGWIAGLMLVALAPFAQANLVTNGNFEAAYDLFGPHAGWAHDADLGYLGEKSAGAFATLNGSNQSVAFQYQSGFQSTISQSLTLNIGTTYDVMFWLNFVDPYDFSALFNGQVVSLLNPVAGSDGWNKYSAQITVNSLAGGSSLVFDSTGGASCSAGATRASDCTIYIDDVSVEMVVVTPPPTSVPEPGTLLLVGAALAAGAMVRRKKKI